MFIIFFAQMYNNMFIFQYLQNKHLVSCLRAPEWRPCWTSCSHCPRDPPAPPPATAPPPALQHHHHQCYHHHHHHHHRHHHCAIIIIIITRPKPAYGRQGQAGVSLGASGAQLGRIGSDHFSRQIHRHFIIIYI